MIIFIDLFCGAGGVTTGIERAKAFKKKAGKVIVGINHDPVAIKSHSFNHKHVLHFVEDVRKVALEPIQELIQHYKEKYPHAAIALWVSAECTNYSKAKGGLPKNADSRTLPRAIYRYIEHLSDLDYIFVENVVEFMSWGPMKNGKPISRFNGVYFQKWRNRIMKYGYRYDHRILNAADYGAMTKRSRYFCQFAKGDLPIVWPAATHAKDPEKFGMFKTGLKKWVPVKHALDLSDEGRSIFDRMEPIRNAKQAKELLKRGKKVKEVYVFPQSQEPLVHAPVMLRIERKDLRRFDSLISEFQQQCGEDLKFFYNDKLSENTLKRIYAGLQKFTPKGDNAFMSQRFGGKPSSKITSLDEPSRTITSTGGNLDLVQANFLSTYYSKDDALRNKSIDEPCGVITTANRHALVKVFLSKQFGGNAKPADMAISAEGPADAITTKDHHALVFLTKTFSGKPQHKNNSIEEPAPTITTFAGINVVNAKFIQKHYTNGGNLESIEEPTGALATKDRIGLVSSHFIERNLKNNTGNSIEEPAGALLTNPKINLVSVKNGWIMNPNFGNVGNSLEDPCPPLMACRKHHYLLNPQYASKGNGIEEPAFTLIARMDKAPPHLVTVEPAGLVAIAVYDDDTEMTLLIKQFMAEHGIIDITMRMLKVRELLTIQGFPKNYYLAGSQTDQKKFIGNSVPPPMAKAIVEAASAAYQEYYQLKIAA